MTHPRTVAGPGPGDLRDCLLYRIYVQDPRTDYTTTTLGYIGETARAAFVRFIEHLYEQPFGDTIVGPPRVDPRTFVGKAAVLAAEQAAVETEKPIYNYEYNLGNADRIPIPEARRQREARDRARGVPSPVWPPARPAAPTPTPAAACQPTPTPAPRRPAAATRPDRPRRPWSKSRRAVAATAAAWSTLTAAGSWAACRYAAAGLLTGVEAGAAAAAGLLLLAYSQSRSKRSPARPLSLWAGLAVIAGALLLVARPSMARWGLHPPFHVTLTR